MDFETSALILAWLAIALLALAMAGLLRQVALLRGQSGTAIRLGPAIGQRAPELRGIDYAANETCLLFADTECESCRSIVEDLRARGDDSSLPEVVVLYRGSANGGRLAPERVFSHQEQLFERFGVSATPVGVMVDRSGRVVAAEALGSTAMFYEFCAGPTRAQEERAA